jgi:hypothetical protein
MSRNVVDEDAGQDTPAQPRQHAPNTVADRQDTGEVPLPGRPEYEELATKLRNGTITAAEFVERIQTALEKE